MFDIVSKIGYDSLRMVFRNPPVDPVASHLFIGFQASKIGGFWDFFSPSGILAQSNDFMIGVPDGAPDFIS